MIESEHHVYPKKYKQVMRTKYPNHDSVNEHVIGLQSGWTSQKETIKLGNHNGRAWFKSRKTGDIVMSDYKKSTSVKKYFFRPTKVHWTGTTGGPANPLPQEFTTWIPAPWNAHQMEFEPDVPDVNLGLLMTRAIAKAQDEEVNLLTTLAEMPETIAMLTDLLKRAKSFRKQGLKHFLAPPKDVAKRAGWKGTKSLSEAWLTYRYGLLPLYYEAQSYLDLLDGKLREYKRGVESLTEKVEAHECREDVQRFFDAGQYNVWTVAYRLEYDWYVEVRGTAGVKRLYDLADKPPPRISVNPVETMWELTPWSFAIDWFIPIGDYLSCFYSTMAAQEGWWKSRKIAIDGSVRLVYLPGDPKSSLGLEMDSTPFLTRSYSERTYVRSAGRGKPDHSLSVDEELNLRRTFDAIALARTNFLATVRRR